MSSVVAWCLAVFPLLALTIYTAEVVAGLRPLRDRVPLPGTPVTTILIPAHDEASGIATTVGRLREDLGDQAHVLVVADNCSDATAHLARGAGAEVVERSDGVNRGKGFALAFGRRHLAAMPPDVVVVLDADCGFVAGGLASLAGAAIDHPAQAVNLLEPDLSAPPLVQISNFAFLMKNRFRARGSSRLSGATVPTGTGMAFPWRIFAELPLGEGITEDLALGVTLVRQDIRTRLVEAAQVRSASASMSAARTQRRRWEHGYLATALHEAPSLLVGGLVRRSRAEFGLGLHLIVPPLSLLYLASVVAFAAAAAMALAGASQVPAIALSGAIATASAVTLIAWIRDGRKWLAPAALLRAPLYVIWKIPLYLGFVRARETRWIRSDRSGG